MGRVMYQEGDWRAVQMIEADQGEPGVGRLVGALALSVAVQADVTRGDAHPRWLAVLVRLEDRRDDQAGQPPGVSHGVVELPLAETRLCSELDHWPVVRVAAADQDMADALAIDRLADLGHHGRRRC